MTKKNPEVDKFLSNDPKWYEEIEQLRLICLDCGLTEEWKWDKPTYTYDEKIVVVVQGFKEYCALLFFNGYLLSDPNGILIKTGENTVVGRQIRFKNVREIFDLEHTLKEYIHEAIKVEKSGLKNEVKKPELQIPEELQNKLDTIPDLKKAYNALTPGRQKRYIIHINQAKQSKTREDRVLKCMPQILAGKGMND
jgi:uncharacterized protein YdeI (YjbR/CyaY-like superfamily)